jgi:glutamate 5-kinase
MEKLLSFGVLPIVNENDTVSTAELEIVGDNPRSVAFSDNDRLAALVMSGLEADVLVLMTNVDGFLGAKQKISASGAGSREEASTISAVERITPELKVLASGPSIGGRGGMQTKLEAAEIAMNCGGVAVIASGRRSDSLQRIFAGEPIGTVFLPSSRMRGKRRWIAYAAGVRGRIVVDAGAFKAIIDQKASLLASGVVQVEGSFRAMDVVSIVDLQGNEFARGIANCASGEVQGTRNAKTLTRNGARQKAASAVVVIRDNIVLLQA